VKIEKEMKFLRLHIHSGFSRCILSGIAGNTLRLFNPVYESLRTAVCALYDSLSFFTSNTFSNLQVIFAEDRQISNIR